MKGRGPTFRQLLLAVNVLAAAVPILAIVGLKLIDSYLIRQTERRLIAESVLIGETWRAFRADEADDRDGEMPEVRPLARRGDRYAPIDPQLDLRHGVLPPPPEPARERPRTDPALRRAGERLGAVLRRAQVFNLSGVRVLDAEGCVVASTRGEIGACFDHLPEVQRALGGSYSAAARQRISDEPAPSLDSPARRRGQVRVFTHTPVLADGEVIGVVRMSRTAMSPEKLLWDDRNRILQVLLACLLVIPAVSLLLSYALSRPLAAITRRAEAIARGEPGEPVDPGLLAPREVHSLTGALERMTRQLTERAEYVREFANHVSHELKTPIAGIGGAAELLRDRWEEMDKARRERFLANISDDAGRMEARVNGLLQLARVENAGALPEESVALEPLLRELTARFDGEIRLDVRTAPAAVRIPRLHLESALGNLLENAVRHGGGAPIDLEATSRPAGGVTFRVRDCGPGIRPANQPRLFDPFFTTERERGGTGLGLAIVKAIANAHGGQVRVETGPEGTTFQLSL